MVLIIGGILLPKNFSNLFQNVLSSFLSNASRRDMKTSMKTIVLAIVRSKKNVIKHWVKLS